MLPLLLLFIAIPILELSIIDQVQQVLGWPTTLIILVLDSLVGAYLVRMQGARAWRRFGQALQRAPLEGRVPAEEVVDGALILVGGALLLTPGFFTDVVGLACVLTPTRSLLNRLVRSRFQVVSGPLGSVFTLGGRRRPAGGPGADGGRPAAGRVRRPPRQPGVIDVEVVDVQRNPREPDDRPS